MSDVDDRTAKIPAFEAAAAKAKADFAGLRKRRGRTSGPTEGKLAEASKALGAEEAKIPPWIRGQYDRLVKAHGADAMAPIEGTSCSHCRVGITAQVYADLQKGQEFFCCRNCGRALYMPA